MLTAVRLSQKSNFGIFVRTLRSSCVPSLNKIVEVLDTFPGGLVSGGWAGRLELEIYI